ncbi:MAG TPA: hypothetical protein DDZ53_08925 [Firmicutes bacterium]|nr:hypothetical protein [Bacillota bacterium]
MKERLERWSRGGFSLTDLIAANAMVIVMQVAEDIAKGVPAPGNFTLGRFVRQLIIMWLVKLGLDRFLVRTDAAKSIRRFRGLAALMLILSVYFFFETWSVARKLSLSGLPLDLVLQRAGVWLACGVAVLASCVCLACCAWIGSRQRVLEHVQDFKLQKNRDERDAELAKRASQAALIASMLLFFLLVPLLELFVLKRYPLLSLGVGGLIGLVWASAYTYWSHKI